jgi:hypothetical protein
VSELKEASKSQRSRGGAPKGNLNGARHPWRTLWRRGAVKPELRWIVPLMHKYAAALEADKGGADNISAAEKSLIEVAAMARGCSSLILQCAGQYGVVAAEKSGGIRTWTISPGLRELPKFLKAEASALLGLGLERRAKPVDSLEAIAREYAEKNAAALSPEQECQDDEGRSVRDDLTNEEPARVVGVRKEVGEDGSQHHGERQPENNHDEAGGEALKERDCGGQSQ